MTITWYNYKRCPCITELTGIAVELPSSELELNCLKGFCTGIGIELELILPELELNCKNGIDPDSDTGTPGTVTCLPVADSDIGTPGTVTCLPVAAVECLKLKR